MFSFENLIGVDNSVQTLMRSVEPDMLMIAFKGANEGVQRSFLPICPLELEQCLSMI